MLRAFLFLCISLFLLGTIGGCGGPAKKVLPKIDVKGKVNLDGTPLPEGYIVFGNPDVLQGGMPITNGQFAGKIAFEPADGVRVEISANRPVKNDLPPALPNDPPPSENFIPANYNANTQLKVDIKKGSLNDFSFDLHSQ